MPADDGDLYEAFTDLTGPGAGHFFEWVELYRESGATVEDPDADKEMFFQFLNAFVPDQDEFGQPVHHDREWWAEIRDLFYNLSEITEADIDWELYRAAIGYG